MHIDTRSRQFCETPVIHLITQPLLRTGFLEILKNILIAMVDIEPSVTHTSVLHNELERMQSAILRSRLNAKEMAGRITAMRIPELPRKPIDGSFVDSILELRIQGDTYMKIARKLNRAGIGSPTGGRWYGASLHRYMRKRCCELLCDWPKRAS